MSSLSEAFPPEIQTVILGYLEDSDPDLLRCELVCREWRQILTQRSLIYQRKCRRFLTSAPGHYDSTFQRHGFTRNRFSSSWCKRFYYKVKNLPRNWSLCPSEGHPEETSRPRITTHKSLEAVVDGRRLQVSEEWGRLHNYQGVYDTVWDPERSLMTCSVYDSIQVWDINAGRCLALLDNDTLDSDGVRSTCFFARDHVLACGTEKGHVRLYDLLSGRALGTYRRSFQYISDVKISGDTLMSIDQFGAMQEWKIAFQDEPSSEPSPSKKARHCDESDGAQKKPVLQFLKEFSPPFTLSNPEVVTEYQRRYWERLLDFNDQLIVTNCSRLFCIFSRNLEKMTEVYVMTSARILCCKVFGGEVYWGEQKGKVFRTGLRANVCKVTNRPETDDDIAVFTTKFEDNITSVDADRRVVAIGDVNGEIQVLKADRFGQPDCLMFVLEDAHSFGAFVWSVHVDASRIFSGDSDGNLVVQDFWDYDDDDVEDPESSSSSNSGLQGVIDSAPVLALEHQSSGADRSETT